MNNLPLIGITMGDPAGIGPEIAVKTLMDPSIYAVCRPILVGEAEVFKHIADHLSIPANFNLIQEIEEARFGDGCINLLDLHTASFDNLQWGEVNATCGEASFQSVKKVIELAMEGKLDATVTGPIHKKAIHVSLRQACDLVKTDRIKQVTELLLGVYSHLVLMGVGYVSSLFFPFVPPDVNLIYTSRLNQQKKQ
jgi:4-hydroxythreonine-4-phosphate dehydrogenase